MVQLNVWTGTKWVNIFDGNDFTNAQADLHRVAKVVEAHTSEIQDATKTASDAVKAVDSAVSASKVNSDAIAAQEKAISEAKVALNSATAEIQQTASNAASDAANIRADVAKVESEVASAKSANQDSINALQSDIDATKKDLADAHSGLLNAQGAITGLQTDVTGIKATIIDHENDIHTLQADSKSLTDDMTDAQGNISKLQKTSTDLTSEMQDHDGRLSKVEQTASTLTTEFSNEQGHLNQVEQTANGTQQTVADQQGQINSIQTDVSGIHETITGQGNQITTINATLNGLDTKYEGVSGNLNNLKSQTQWATVTSAVDLNNIKTPCHEFLKGPATNAPNETAWWYLTVEGSEGNRVTQTVIADQSNNRYTRRFTDGWSAGWSAWVRDATQTDVTALSNRITTNSTQITQNQQAIALKADQATVNTLSGEVSQNTAQLKVQADQISSKVSSEDFSALDNKVGSAIAQIDKNTTAIDQNSKQISLKADQTEVDNVKNTASNNSSRLDIMANEIQSKVTSTDVNNIVDGRGFITQQVAQSLIDQKADTITESITGLSQKVDNNNQATVDKIQQITASIDGVQSIVKDKADQSQVTQLSNALQIKMTGATIANASDVTLTYTGKENEYPPAAPLVGMNDVDKGSTLILSFDYVASDDTKLIPQLDGTPWIPWGTIVNATPAAKGKKGSYSMTITVNDDSWQKGDAKNVCIRCDGFKGTIEITNLVLKYADTVHDVQSTFDMLRDDINLRVTKGNLLSQINLTAGNTLIQSGKIYLDADSVVFGENSKAFIPSAYITDINADKITTGILKSIAINNGDGAFTVNPSGDVVANSITVRNGNIFQGQIIGAGFYAINRTTDTNKNFTSLEQVDDSIDTWMKINGQIMEWHGKDDDYASIGPRMPYVTSDQTGGNNENLTKGLTIVGTNGVTISGGSKAEWGNVEPNFRVQTKSNISFALPTNFSVDTEEVKVNLDTGTDFSDDNKKGAQFTIQKDNKVGAYFGMGNNGNEINFATGGDGAINFNSPLNVYGPLNVTGAKHSIVKTSQGYVGINAYETAEYYFGDIGEANTGDGSQVIIGIDKIFSETINTTVPYQVFITPYSDCHVWVDQRFGNRFVIKSDKPNAQFGWELKAKRKGYENYRLRHVDGIKEKGEFKV